MKKGQHPLPKFRKKLEHNGENAYLSILIQNSVFT